MKNRWDITVEQSNYDFNPFRESDHGKSFRTVGNIYEDWKEEVKEKVRELDEVNEVELELTFDPPWTRDLISEEAKLELGFL